MAAENGNGGGALGWIRENLISLLAAGILWFAGDSFIGLRNDIKDVATLARALDKKVDGHETRIAGLKERVSRLEINYMPWMRMQQRGSGLPEAPHEQPPDTPRHGLPVERRFN